MATDNIFASLEAFKLKLLRESQYNQANSYNSDGSGALVMKVSMSPLDLHPQKHPAAT